MKNKTIKIEKFRTLDEAVRLLIDAKEKGLNAYCDFNGHKLYSENITIDSAYIEVTGKTKEEYNLSKKEDIEKLKKEQELAKENVKRNIPIWIARGKKIINEEKHQEWENCVINCANSIYNGEELNAALDIMEILENENSLELAIELFKNQNHSGNSEKIVKNIIYIFSNKGQKFYTKVNYPKTLTTLKKIKTLKK